MCQLISRFNQFVAENGLFKKGEKLLLAVSGGIDSVVMTELIYRSGYQFSIAHCNFRLRGSESDMDEIFVREMGKRYQCEVFVRTFDTLELRKSLDGSVQMVARELRYDWFQELVEKNGFECCATAHNLDDQHETFFINLIRGSGIEGLSGIPVKRNVFARPLLFASREEISLFAAHNNLEFREDSSNSSVRYLRNRIRHELLPWFEEFKPGFDRILSKSIDNISQTSDLFLELINQKKEDICTVKGSDLLISIKKLQEIKNSFLLLFYLLKPYGFSADTVKQIFENLDLQPGKVFYGKGFRLVIDRQFLIVGDIGNDKIVQAYFIDENEEYLKEPVALKFQVVKNDSYFQFSNDSSTEAFDFSKLTFPLELRKWRRGDYFYPLGSNGKKKISDFFTDNKLSIPEKERCWILCSAGSVVWIVGYRMDERFRVDSHTTLIWKAEILR